MQVNVITSPPGQNHAENCRAARHAIVICGASAKITDPRALICQAASVIKSCKPNLQNRTKAALKAIGLMVAAGRGASTLGSWSVAPDYDPLPDFMGLQSLANTWLGPDQGGEHPISQLRAGIAQTIRLLAERTA